MNIEARLEEWFFKDGERTVGPVTAQVLKALCANGTPSATSTSVAPEVGHGPVFCPRRITNARRRPTSPRYRCWIRCRQGYLASIGYNHDERRRLVAVRQAEHLETGRPASAAQAVAAPSHPRTCRPWHVPGGASAHAGTRFPIFHLLEHCRPSTHTKAGRALAFPSPARAERRRGQFRSNRPASVRVPFLLSSVQFTAIKLAG
jgi:hypothetical protein